MAILYRWLGRWHWTCHFKGGREGDMKMDICEHWAPGIKKIMKCKASEPYLCVKFEKDGEGQYDWE